MISSPDLPIIQNISLRKNNKDKHPLELSLTASICLDFASPDTFSSLPSSPGLILAPARTWQSDVSIAMWEQVKARAEEIGSVALFCDGGEGGMSGIVGEGWSEPTQVGGGSWVRTLPLQSSSDTSRTVYATVGDWGMLAFVWLLVAVSTETVLKRVRSVSDGTGHGYWRSRARDVAARLRGLVRQNGQKSGEDEPLLG